MSEETFADVLHQTTINIPRAAFYLARTLAYPRLDVDFYLSRLDAMAEGARSLLSNCASLADQADSLSSYLFDTLEFHGNRADYYDPRNFFLNCVMDRKLGSPIALSILFTGIAQRLGMRAYGIGLPGHFIVGLYDGVSEIRVDPFNAGLRLSVNDCEQLVQESTGFKGPFQQKWLKPASSMNVLARLLNNLCNAYVERENWQSAIPVIQNLLLLQPESESHLRNLGYVHLYNGSLRLSAQYLEEYLRRAPDAPDFENVRSSLQIVAGRLALWN